VGGFFEIASKQRISKFPETYGCLKQSSQDFIQIIVFCFQTWISKDWLSCYTTSAKMSCLGQKKLTYALRSSALRLMVVRFTCAD